MSNTPVVVFDHVSIAFDDQVVLTDVSFSLLAGHMKMLLGASGSGKSVILKLILGLMRPDRGRILVNGHRIDTMTERELRQVRGGIGMLFQEGALFDSLTVAENVGYRLLEETDMPPKQVHQRVKEVLGFVGLAEYTDRTPDELSGGQRRRVAIARAIAADARLLLFDSPTSGLDPVTAKTVDAEIIKLRDLEQATSIVVTHELEDAFYIATHRALRNGDTVSIVPADPNTISEPEFMVLKDGRIQFEGNAAALRASKDPYLLRYLSSFMLGWRHAA